MASGGAGNASNYGTFEIAGTSTATQDADFLASGINYAISSTGGADFIDLPNAADVTISGGAVGGTTQLELKTDSALDSLSVTLDSTAAAQTINNLDVDADGTNTVNEVTFTTTGANGSTVTTNNVNATNVLVDGDTALDLGTLETATTNVDGRDFTGDLTVAVDATQSAVTTIRGGEGDDGITLNGAAGGDATVLAGAGDDTITVAGAQEHSVSLGDGADTVDFNDLATAITTGNAISTATEFATIDGFTGGTDDIVLDNGTFGGLTAGSSLATGEYIEGTLASTSATDAQVETIASNAGVGGAQQYVASVDIGSDVYVFYDADGHGTAGGVSLVGVLSNSDLDNVSSTDFSVA